MVGVVGSSPIVPTNASSELPIIFFVGNQPVSIGKMCVAWLSSSRRSIFGPMPITVPSTFLKISQ